ncbi:TPM domain-containing protein [Piscinibacter sakaiensis]|uniref:TPM domain-containing protein n=1 Tax=Piscinibacter sakaiensis TaxID=1547922 RepID=UPI003AAD7740
MNKWMRLLRHRFYDERYARRAVGRDALDRIHAAIAHSEAGHSGEIRVCIEGGMPLSYLWRNADARERAVNMFGKLGVWDTEQNNGVLIYLLLADHRIEIVADRGLNRHVDAAQWRQIVDHLAAACRARQFEAGLLGAIDEVDAVLRRLFPREAGQPDINELPDRPDVR